MHWVNEHWVQLFINDQLHSMLIYSIEKTPSSRDHRSPLFLMHPLVLTPSVTIYYHGWTRLVIRSEKSLNEYKIPQMVQAQFWGPNIYFCHRSKLAKWFRLNSDSSIAMYCFKVTWGERLVARKKLLFWCLCCLSYICQPKRWSTMQTKNKWFIFVNRPLHRKDDQWLKTNEIWSGGEKFAWGRRCSRVWSSASSSPSSSQRRRQGWSRCKGWLHAQPLL